MAIGNSNRHLDLFEFTIASLKIGSTHFAKSRNYSSIKSVRTIRSVCLPSETYNSALLACLLAWILGCVVRWLFVWLVVRLSVCLSVWLLVRCFVLKNRHSHLPPQTMRIPLGLRHQTMDHRLQHLQTWPITSPPRFPHDVLPKSQHIRTPPANTLALRPFAPPQANAQTTKPKHMANRRTHSSNQWGQ